MPRSRTPPPLWSTRASRGESADSSSAPFTKVVSQRKRNQEQRDGQDHARAPAPAKRQGHLRRPPSRLHSRGGIYAGRSGTEDASTEPEPDLRRNNGLRRVAHPQPDIPRLSVLGTVSPAVS